MSVNGTPISLGCQCFSLAVKSARVPGNILLPFRRHVVLLKDRPDRTLGLTAPTADALLRVDEQLQGGTIPRLSFRRVDSIHWAHLDARRVLDIYARFRDYIGHSYILHQPGLPR